MNNLDVIDRFLQAFITYIDAGFGLLGGDVAFLTTTLIGIDITLAGLFWAMAGEHDVLGRFVKKILYIGAFAFIIGHFSLLGDIIFRSFSAAGITAGDGTITADQLLQPGRLAGIGFTAAWPLAVQAGKVLTFGSFFKGLLVVVILLFAWAMVILAFFILAVQMFVTIVEFKLTMLAGFLLVPFALWNRTSFLAERVLGNVVSSGVKVMVLAVVIGIGSNFFQANASSFALTGPDIGQAMSLVLAALTLFGLGIFCPSIASGIVSGAPQLGAGATAGTVMGAAGATMLAGGAAVGGARMIGGAAMGAVRAGASMGSAASTAYTLGRETGSGSVGAGLRGAGSYVASASSQKMKNAAGVGAAIESGQKAVFQTLARGGAAPAGAASIADGAPDWARKLQSSQAARHHRQMSLHALSQGDRGGAGAAPDIKERD